MTRNSTEEENGETSSNTEAAVYFHPACNITWIRFFLFSRLHLIKYVFATKFNFRNQFAQLKEHQANQHIFYKLVCLNLIKKF